MSKITMREAISQALMEEMDRDPAVFIMGEEVGLWVARWVGADVSWAQHTHRLPTSSLHISRGSR